MHLPPTLTLLALATSLPLGLSAALMPRGRLDLALAPDLEARDPAANLNLNGPRCPNGWFACLVRTYRTHPRNGVFQFFPN